MDLEFSPISFEDGDQFAAWEIEMGWSIESTQLSYGPNHIGFDCFALPELLVSHFHTAQSQYDVFELPPGIVLFVLCRKKLPVIWSGREIPPTMLAVVRAGTNHTAKIPAGWDCYEFMVAEDLIRRTEIFPPDFFERTTQFEKACLPLPEPETGRLLAILDGFFAQARRSNGSSPDPVDGAEFCNIVLPALQRAIDAGLDAMGAPAPKENRRAHLVRGAREFMAANLTRNLTADEIAQALGVSYRALHYAFQDALGVSPYRYFLTEKLHAVRRQLKAGDASVTRASFSHGFYAPSRFARQYRRLFGELPSETGRL